MVGNRSHFQRGLKASQASQKSIWDFDLDGSARFQVALTIGHGCFTGVAQGGDESPRLLLVGILLVR